MPAAAAMGETDRADCWADAMRRFPGSTPLTKAQLRAVIDALDSYFDSTATNANNAIPQPQRGLLTTEQKAFLSAMVITKRWNSGA